MSNQASSQRLPICSSCLGPWEPGRYRTCDACRRRNRNSRHTATYTGTVTTEPRSSEVSEFQQLRPVMAPATLPVTPHSETPVQATTSTFAALQTPLAQPIRQTVCSRCNRPWESAATGYQACTNCRVHGRTGASTGATAPGGAFQWTFQWIRPAPTLPWWE